MTRRGYSLLEAIISSFLLLAAFFVVSRLFHTGLQYSHKIEKRLLAIHLAEKRLAELRQSVEEKGWNDIPEGPDPTAPGYQIEVELHDHTLYSPSRQLESDFGSSNGGKRSIEKQARRAVVTVSWEPSGSFQLEGIVTTRNRKYLGSPEVQVVGNTLTVDPKSAAELKVVGSIPSVLQGAGPVVLSARGFDAANQEIEDLFFHWTVEPYYGSGAPATGRIEFVTRDGRTVEFYNQVRRKNGDWVTQNGWVHVRVQAKYDGVVGAGRTPPIELKQ